MSRLPLLPALLLATAGCASVGSGDFTCTGANEPGCRPAREVLRAGDEGRISDLRAEVEERRQSARDLEDVRAAPPPAAIAPAGEAVLQRYDPALPVPIVDGGEVPIRFPAVVMRIWTAPFEDRSGTLTMPGYLYTEVEPSTWTVAPPGSRQAVAVRSRSVRATPSTR